jgi:hypothetical protein
MATDYRKQTSQDRRVVTTNKQSPYVEACWSGAISTIRNSGKPRSRLHLLDMLSVFGSTRNLYGQPIASRAEIAMVSDRSD